MTVINEKGVLTSITDSEKMAWGDYRIPENVREIGLGVFQNTNFRAITIHSNIVAIHREAFLDCLALRAITITEGVLEKIDEHAFRGCPINVIYIQTSRQDEFQRIKNLFPPELQEKARLDDKNTYTEAPRITSDNPFSNCTSLKTITLPKGLKKIGENAFAQCVSLESIKLSEEQFQAPFLQGGSQIMAGRTSEEESQDQGEALTPRPPKP